MRQVAPGEVRPTGANPVAMQMGYLQARADVASDQSATIIILPLELMRPFMNPELIAEGVRLPTNTAN
jgi:hypothetical protein